MLSTLPIFKELLKFLPKKLSPNSQKYRFGWDPGFEIRDPEKIYSRSRIPDPGVKKAPDPGSRIWISNTAYNRWEGTCRLVEFLLHVNKMAYIICRWIQSCGTTC
jgi:hypothetical protein